MVEHMFETSTTAESWEDGLIIGSGRVGAVVYGPADAISVSLAHESYFLPLNPRPNAPDLAPVRAHLRAALLAGDAGEASAALTQGSRASGYGDALIWTDPLGLCATLTIRTPGGVAEARRIIDPLLGEVTVEWTDLAHRQHTLRFIAPYGSESVLIAMEGESESTSVIGLGLGAGGATPLDTGVPDGSTAVTATVAGGDRGILEATAGSGPTAVRAAVAVHTGTLWQAEPGVTRSDVLFGPGVPRIVSIDVRVPAGPPGSGPARSLPASWNDVRLEEKHAREPLTGASLLDLAGASAATRTEDLWAQARAGDERARRRVVEAAYLSGRANIIASTGALPATLQGVWQGTWRPAWSADYTLNGNVQNGALAGLTATGTPELALSLLNLVLPHLEDYRNNARLIFGAEGMLLPSRMSTHGRANHFSEDYPQVFWTGCGGWVLRILADVVATTGDRSIVNDQVWELVEGVLRFAETALVDVDGVSRIIPSYSPENTPGGARVPLATDAAADVAILRDAARATKLLGRARGDDSLNDRWAHVLEGLPPYRVAGDGTLAEWLIGPWSENMAHRHASQLYPLWYEIDPAFEGDGEEAARLRAAAAATVRGKIAWRAAAPSAPPGRMEMAFGLVQVGLAAAALGDAAAAETCVNWLALEHWSPTLTTTHDAGSIFNLDASGGLPGLVAAMLLGSGADSLSVLPALPASWPSGRVTGLRARGGLVIDQLEWNPRGASLTVRRLPGAAWLAPAEGTLLRLPRPATLLVDGRPTDAGRLGIGPRPLHVEVEWLAD